MIQEIMTFFLTQSSKTSIFYKQIISYPNKITMLNNIFSRLASFSFAFSFATKFLRDKVNFDRYRNINFYFSILS